MWMNGYNIIFNFAFWRTNMNISRLNMLKVNKTIQLVACNVSCFYSFVLHVKLHLILPEDHFKITTKKRLLWVFLSCFPKISSIIYNFYLIPDFEIWRRRLRKENNETLNFLILLIIIFVWMFAIKLEPIIYASIQWSFNILFIAYPAYGRS